MHVFIHSRRVARMICIFYILLVGAVLLGVVQKGGSSSRLFPANTVMVGFCLLFYFFTNCISTPWIFACSGFSSVSDLDNFLGCLLRYWGSLQYFCQKFSGGGSKVIRDFSWLRFQLFTKRVSGDIGELVGCLCTIWLRLSLLISLGGIRSCLWITWLSHTRLVVFYLGCLSLVIPDLSGGFRGYRKELLCCVSGSLLPAFFLSRIIT